MNRRDTVRKDLTNIPDTCKIPNVRCVASLMINTGATISAEVAEW